MSKRLDVTVGMRLRDRDGRTGGRIVEVVEAHKRMRIRCVVVVPSIGARHTSGRETLITPDPRRWEVVS